MSNLIENSSLVDRGGDHSIAALHASNGNAQGASSETEQIFPFPPSPFLGIGVFDAWRKYARTVAVYVSPAVRKSAEAWISLGQENSRLTAKLIGAVIPANPGSVAESAGRVWHDAIEAVGKTLDAAAQANAEIVEMWTDAISATLSKVHEEGSSTMAEPIVLSVAEHSAVTHEKIQRLAYDLWERKGRRHGMDWEDWFEAEAALVQGSRLAA